MAYALAVVLIERVPSRRRAPPRRPGRRPGRPCRNRRSEASDAVTSAKSTRDRRWVVVVAASPTQHRVVGAATERQSSRAASTERGRRPEADVPVDRAGGSPAASSVAVTSAWRGSVALDRRRRLGGLGWSSCAARAGAADRASADPARGRAGRARTWCCATCSARSTVPLAPRSTRSLRRAGRCAVDGRRPALRLRRRSARSPRRQRSSGDGGRRRRPSARRPRSSTTAVRRAADRCTAAAGRRGAGGIEEGSRGAAARLGRRRTPRPGPGRSSCCPGCAAWLVALRWCSDRRARLRAGLQTRRAALMSSRSASRPAGRRDPGGVRRRPRGPPGRRPRGST